MKQIYIFSGLGVDHRVFEKLELPGFEVHFVKWIKPIHKERISDYVRRLTDQIPAKLPILIGLSFGGMIAIEVGKLIKTEQIIIIASAKTRSELPFYYRLAGQLNLHKLIPVGLLKQSNRLNNWLFGIENNEEQQLLKTILKDTDPGFLKWAIDQIVNWKNTMQHENLIHIHGTADKILPYQFVKANLTINGGGHFMTVNKAQQLNMELLKLLKKA